MSFSFEQVNFEKLYKKSNSKSNIQYDKTTSETYRVKRLFKLDPFTDHEISKERLFEFKYKWNPYNGERTEIDEVGPLCFNALNLYDYYFANRFKELWNPQTDQYEGYYGDIVGSGKNLEIKSRGSYPEKYLFRLPITDCYLPIDHNFAIITMGPILNEEEIIEIDNIILKYHRNIKKYNFTSLIDLKLYYDNAIKNNYDEEDFEFKNIKINNPHLTLDEIKEKYNRYWVDKLIKL